MYLTEILFPARKKAPAYDLGQGPLQVVVQYSGFVGIEFPSSGAPQTGFKFIQDTNER